MTGSQEKRCACPSNDARTCMQVRYPPSIVDDTETEFQYMHERCDCPCHEEYRQHIEDENEALL
jgi:hypothetical protein